MFVVFIGAAEVGIGFSAAIGCGNEVEAICCRIVLTEGNGHAIDELQNSDTILRLREEKTDEGGRRKYLDIMIRKMKQNVYIQEKICRWI